MHPNEIDLTKLTTIELEVLRNNTKNMYSERHIEALNEQFKRQTEAQ